MNCNLKVKDKKQTLFMVQSLIEWQKPI